jgi:signal transduction protein with GAF and PtsI domain
LHTHGEPMNRVDPECPTAETSDLTFLRGIADRISSALSVHGVLNETAESVAAILDCDECAIYLLEGDHLIERASSSTRKPVNANRVPHKVREDMRHWEPVVIAEGAHKDPRFRRFDNVPGDSFEAFLSIPIISGGLLVGVINAESRARRDYSDREVNLVATLASLAGTEIKIKRLKSDNALLAQELESREEIEQAARFLETNSVMNLTDAHRWIQRQSGRSSESMTNLAARASLTDRLRGEPKSVDDGAGISVKNPRLLS